MKQETSVTLSGGKTISFETGHWAKQAHGSAVVRLGDTVVLASACSNAEPRLGIDFFPLTVDYREYTYAGGRIPGGFIKREGRMSEREVLTSRQIDRPIRPLFPEGYRFETQVIAFVLSADKENDPDVAGINGASDRKFSPAVRSIVPSVRYFQKATASRPRSLRSYFQPIRKMTPTLPALTALQIGSSHQPSDRSSHPSVISRRLPLRDPGHCVRTFSR